MPVLARNSANVAVTGWRNGAWENQVLLDTDFISRQYLSQLQKYSADMLTTILRRLRASQIDLATISGGDFRLPSCSATMTCWCVLGTFNSFSFRTLLILLIGSTTFYIVRYGSSQFPLGITSHSNGRALVRIGIHTL